MRSKREHTLAPAAAFAVALLATALATLVRWLLDPSLGNNYPLITTFAAVAAAAWVGGYRLALFTTILNYVISDMLFTAHRGTFDFGSTLTQVSALAYLGTCGLIILIAEAHHRAQRQSDIHREWLDTTVRSLGDAVIATNADGTVALMNPIAESLTGWTDAEARGRKLEEIFVILNEQTKEPCESPVAKVLSTGRVVGLANHTVLVARDGSHCPIDDSAAPIRDVDGNIAGVVLVFRDVTEARKSERDARFLASIVETSDDAIVTKDINGIITSWNSSAERIFGYTAEEAVGKPVAMLAPPDRPNEMRSILTQIRSGKRVDHFDTVRRAKDGRLIPISLTVSPIRDVDGEIIGASKIARDISDRKRAEEIIQEEKARLRTTLLSIGDGVIVTDHEGHVTMLNPVACELTGWGDEAIGMPIAEVFTIVNEDTRAEVENPAVRALRDGSIVGLSNHTILIAKTGVEHPIDDSAAAIKDEEGAIVGSVLVFRDVSTRREAERRIYDLMVELRSADHKKDEFLATLAHELRGPLAPLRNMLEVMKRSEGDPDLTRRSRESMERQLGQMIRLVDDLLDVSRITRNKLELRLENVDLASVIQQSVETIRPLVEKAGHHLDVDLSDSPIVLRGDPMRLSQVFTNLLNNACKYTEPGGALCIRATCEGSDAVVKVRDSGIGIPKDRLEGVFEMFSQIESAIDRSQGGLGIGLTLAKRLVEMHGGRVEAKSDGPGHGAEFVVRLPMPVVGIEPDVPMPNLAIDEPSHRRILIVDDNKDSAQSLAILLSMSGNVTATAHDGLEALEVAEEFRPDVALLDIGLPRLNGYEVARRLRETEAGKGVLLIATTGWGQREDRKKSMDAGFQHHLVKPVDYDVLLELLRTEPDRTAVP